MLRTIVVSKVTGRNAAAFAVHYFAPPPVEVAALAVATKRHFTTMCNGSVVPASQRRSHSIGTVKAEGNPTFEQAESRAALSHTRVRKDSDDFVSPRAQAKRQSKEQKRGGKK
jgi:hypothetical protein